MSTSRAIKPPRRGDTLLTDWQHAPDQAPSIVRQEQPTIARVIALVGLFLILLGMIPVFYRLAKIERAPIIEAGTGFVCITSGLMLVLVHAFVDRERVFRRIYAYVGIGLIGVAILMRILPVEGVYGANFPYFGFPSLLLGLVFTIASARLETDKGMRTIFISILGGIGAIEILSAVLIGVFTRLPFLAGEGGVHMIMGLLFVGAYIALQDSDDTAYYAGLGLAAVGALAFAGGLIRSLMPDTGGVFFVPNGLILMGAGLAYLALAAGVCLDWPIVVLTRRELSSYFYSPVAYLVLIGMLAVGWIMFRQFLSIIAQSSMGGPGAPPLFEPIVAMYVFELIPVIVQIFVVPAITMRLLAEEQRTGTLEVLLTAPVNETTVVVSKFLAAWLFYLLTWVPWWLYLVALRYMGDTEFDYRPLLSFNVTLLAVSAGFISMGLFFSSLTRNQIIAAVLTFVGMIGHLTAYIMKYRERLTPGSTWYEVLTYTSFLDVWLNSLEGVFSPRYLIFHLSVTVFFLYATIKVLETRKWK
jgi:ABC-type transport system involved in multi-copper enzyme maturation permease subunit